MAYFTPVDSFFPAFLVAFGFIAVAEMGDKTQLLAMAFATRYSATKILIGIFIATIISHALAVAAGNFVARFESLNLVVQACAAVSFILFGLWTLRGDKLDGESKKPSRFGPIATVAVAFVHKEEHDVWHYVVTFEKCVVPVTVFGIDTTENCGPLSNIDLVHFVWEHFFVSVTKDVHWLSHPAALLSFQNCCF